MVFPESDYDPTALTESNNVYTFTHKAIGADKFRYTGDYGKTWSDWKDFEASTTIDGNIFQNKENVWKGAHIIVQCRPRFPSLHLLLLMILLRLEQECRVGQHRRSLRRHVRWTSSSCAPVHGSWPFQQLGFR